MTSGERLGVVFFALLLAGLVAAELLSDFTPRKLSVFFIAGFWIPLLLIHELGHALCARAVGWRVHEMVIGFGPEVARFQALGASVVLRLIPVEGHVVPAPSDLAGARGKSALIYFAGPAAELICALAILLVMGPERMFSLSDGLATIAGQSFALAALVGALMNLVPHAASGGVSDGLGILLSFSQRDEHFAYRMALPTMNACQRRIEADDAAGALAHLDAEIARHPDNAFLPIMRVRCIAATGAHAEALEVLERMREQPAHTDLVEGERLHAAACVVLESGDRSLLGDAEGACRAALERLGPSRDVQVTLAAVLLEQARHREAEELLQAVYKATREPWIEDRCLAYLAITAQALGRPDDASRFRTAFEARSHNRRLRRLLDSVWNT